MCDLLCAYFWRYFSFRNYGRGNSPQVCFVLLLVLQNSISLYSGCNRVGWLYYILDIRPKETFSFYWLVRNADKKEPYKDGLNLVDGKIIGSYGGGLCQLSNLLFWCFLHTPLTIVERHGHAVESFPSTTEDLPKGTDATVSEGWCDLQVRNDTDNTFQIEVAFDESNIYGRIYTAEPVTKEYSIYNSSVTYVRQNGKIFQMAEVCRTETDTISGKTMKHLLYTNKCEITYLLPEGMEVQEK